jgi:putative membrane protein
MKNRTLSLFLLAAGTLVFHSCQSSDRNREIADSIVVDPAVVDTTKISGRAKLENGIQAAMFIETAAANNMLEVTLGKLAFEKANNQGVRAYGKLMEQDHKQIHDALTVLSAAKGLKLPVSLPPKKMEQVRQMEKMETAYFEKLYLKMMIEDHNKDIELFKGAGDSPDTAISNFSRQVLPVLESHLEKALKVREGIK